MALREIRTVLQDLLKRPHEWKILSTLTPPDLSPVDHPKTVEWIRAASTHRHPFRQILIVLQSTQQVVYNTVIGGQVYAATPGTIIFIDTLECHATIERSLTAPVVVLRTNLLQGRVFSHLWVYGSNLLAENASGDDIFTPGESCRYLERRWSDLRERPSLPAILKRSMLMHAVGSLIAGMLEHWTPEHRTTRLTSEEIWTEVAEHLQETGGLGASIDTLAAAVECDQKQLIQLCRQYEGLSLPQYIRWCRIKKARNLLDKGYSHKETAAMLGFAHLSAFSRWHAKHLPKVH